MGTIVAALGIDAGQSGIISDTGGYHRRVFRVANAGQKHISPMPVGCWDLSVSGTLDLDCDYLPAGTVLITPINTVSDMSMRVTGSSEHSLGFESRNDNSLAGLMRADSWSVLRPT